MPCPAAKRRARNNAHRMAMDKALEAKRTTLVDLDSVVSRFEGLRVLFSVESETKAELEEADGVPEVSADPIETPPEPDLANEIQNILDIWSKEAGAGMQKTATKAAGILYLKDNKVLLLMRGENQDDFPNHWGFPAGHIEDGESPLVAALRESNEEVGYSPETAQLLYEKDGFAQFVCRSHDFPVTLSDESQGYLWADIHNLPEPLHPGVKEAIQAATIVGTMDKRDLDINGWFEIQDNPVSKVGVYEYRGSQLKGAPDPNKIYKVFRSAEELSRPETINSFKLNPWINDHLMLGSEELGLTPAEQKGVGGVTGEKVYFKDGTLFTNLKLFSQSMADAIKNGKKELSLGYRCDYLWEPGEYNGEHYDCKQIDILGNHLALVKEGRMGPEVAVLDHADISRFVFTCDSKNLEITPMAEPSTSPEAGNEESSGMTLEEARSQFNSIVEKIDEILPVLSKIKGVIEPEAKDEDEENPVGAKEAEEVEEVTDSDDPVEPEADPEKAAEEAGKKAAEEEQAKAMDEADLFRKFQARIASKEKLAAKLAPHIGTFDHSLMNEDEVAVYGCKKLKLGGIPKGQERSFLDGYLSAASVEKAKPVTSAQDGSDGDWLAKQRATFTH